MSDPDAALSGRTVSIVAVGDMMFDTRLRPARLFFYKPEIATCAADVPSPVAVPFVNTEESRQWLALRGLSTHGIELTSHAHRSRPLGLRDVDADFPFRAIGDVLRASDVVFGNLECPLSERGRPTANDRCYRASPDFARAMAAASFRVVSFANDHCMDYGEAAFLDTLEALQQNDIAVVGAGRSLKDARRPAMFDVKGVRVAFLGYTMVGPDGVFAVDGESGAVPLNPLLAAQDIRSIRLDVDAIVLSVHWGVEEAAAPGAHLTELAHHLVDAGADVILGHHPHVPGSVEIYRGRPIFYSLGNFCFGHDHAGWSDNAIARLLVADDGIRAVELLAVGGSAHGRYQPFLLDNGSAARLRDRLRVFSEPYGTRLDTLDNGHLVARAMGA